MKLKFAWTKKNGETVTNQIYTTEKIQDKLTQLENEGATNIIVKSVDDENDNNEDLTNEIVNYLYDNIYDPWTDENITPATIKEGLKDTEETLYIMQTLIERIKELENTIEEDLKK